MSQHDTSDKDLECANCGEGFVFSAGEQELFRLRGITAIPEHCPSCARGRVMVSRRKGGTHPSFG